MIALIDGDLVAYRCAASCEKRDKDGTILTLEPVEIALHRVDELMRRLLSETGSESFHCYLSPSSNFRYLVNPEYKANRTSPDPTWREACKEFLITEWSAKLEEWYEADDLLGINQTDQTVIVSLDKDLRMIPGNHYSWEIGTISWTRQAESFSVTHEEGTRKFYEQMLIGDKTDNIIGINGLGPVKSAKYLSSCETEEEMFEAVYNKYNDPQRFLMNGCCLWICQNKGETWLQHLQNQDWILLKELKPEVDHLLESMKSFIMTI